MPEETFSAKNNQKTAISALNQKFVGFIRCQNSSMAFVAIGRTKYIKAIKRLS